MAMTAHDRGQEILALEPRVFDWARSLTSDPEEARALTRETLELAKGEAVWRIGAVTTQAWLFRLLRQRFYSIERSRNHVRSRSALVTELAYAQKRARLALAAAELEDV